MRDVQGVSEISQDIFFGEGRKILGFEEFDVSLLC